MLCACFSMLGMQVSGPLRKAAIIRRQNDNLLRELSELNHRNQELERENRALESGVGVSSFLKEKGYMPADQRPLRVRLEQGAASIAPPPEK